MQCMTFTDVIAGSYANGLKKKEDYGLKNTLVKKEQSTLSTK